MQLRRDILLFLAVAAAAAVGGWWLLSNRPGAAIETFQREQRLRVEAAKQRPAPADAFQATICAASPCVVVEAGGLSFIFGAGEGAAEGIVQLGKMHPNIDALLLPDLTLESVEGLPAIAAAAARAGRQEPLRIFGPAGLLPVVDGANLMVSATQTVRLAPGIEGEDQDGYGRLVFDSGVVSVRGFGGAEPGVGRVYRVDFEARSLILAGCSALPADIIGAARGVTAPDAVVMAGSEMLLGSPPQCIDLQTVVQAIGQARIAASVVVPTHPAASDAVAIAAWRDTLAELDLPDLRIGLPGTMLDLTGNVDRTGKDGQN